ncbi:uncharacterized protein LOC111071942 [Drosophila obscura]|uniref:uncharacterized protein LOC111071942 n=1 Tax=Drosophila obscura TaxID=7282 RepID=UPI001BB1E012|nr:uncharacterized protein LOC111071942 [Drosophila obscura]
MEWNQRHTMAECAMDAFCNGQYYESLCFASGLAHIQGKMSRHERQLMGDIFLGIINRIILDVDALKAQLATKVQALLQLIEPTEEQKMDVQADSDAIKNLLWHLTTYVHEMADIIRKAQRSYHVDDHEPNIYFLRLLGECLGIMGHMVNTDDGLVNIAASTAFAFGVVYGFNVPPTDPTNLENIISYCIFSVRNMRNIDVAIELAIYGLTSCTEQLILRSSNPQATRLRLQILESCLEVWIAIRDIDPAVAVLIDANSDADGDIELFCLSACRPPALLPQPCGFYCSLLLFLLAAGYDYDAASIGAEQPIRWRMT